MSVWSARLTQPHRLHRLYLFVMTDEMNVVHCVLARVYDEESWLPQPQPRPQASMPDVVFLETQSSDLGAPSSQRRAECVAFQDSSTGQQSHVMTLEV